MNINQKIYDSIDISRQSKVPLLFLANSGFGKSTSIQKYADMNGYLVKEVRGSEHSSDDILGFPINNNGKLEKLYPYWFEEICSNSDKKYILLFDELTGVNEYVQAAMLNIISGRNINGRYLPESTLIITAGNYSKNLSGNFNLIYPTLARFAVVNINSDPSSDIDVYLSKYNKSEYFYSVPKVTSLSEERKSEIELSIRTTTLDLLKQGYLDFSNKDFTNVYSDQDHVYGYVNWRSLNYLRDIVIASIELYGRVTETCQDMLMGVIGGGSNLKTAKDINYVEIYVNSIKKSGTKFVELEHALISSNDYILKLIHNFNSNLLFKDTKSFSLLCDIIHDNVLDFTKNNEYTPSNGIYCYNVLKLLKLIPQKNNEITTSVLKVKSLISKCSFAFSNEPFFNDLIDNL